MAQGQRLVLRRKRIAMKTILETNRLHLREFVMDDLEDFFRMVSDIFAPSK